MTVIEPADMPVTVFIRKVDGLPTYARCACAWESKTCYGRDAVEELGEIVMDHQFETGHDSYNGYTVRVTERQY